MTVAQLKEALNDPRLYEHTEVMIRIKDQTCDYQNPDDDEACVIEAHVECAGKRVLVLTPEDSLVLMYPNGKVTHL